MTRAFASIALLTLRMLCPVAVLAPVLVVSGAGAAPQKCLICCEVCKCPVCGNTCRRVLGDGRTEDDDCENARAALRSALSAGQVGVYRGGKEVGPGEASGHLDGMSCAEVIRKAEELTSFKRRPSRDQGRGEGGDEGASVPNGISRPDRGADPAPPADPFKHTAGQVERGHEAFWPRGRGWRNPPLAAPREPPDPVLGAINEGKWDDVEGIVAQQFKEFQMNQLGKELEGRIERLKSNAPAPYDPAADVAVVKAILSHGPDAQAANGKPSSPVLPAAVHAANATMQGIDGVPSSYSYAASVIHAATGQDPRPFMSPTWVDAAGVGLEGGQAAAGFVPKLRPLAWVSPVTPGLRVSPETGRAEWVYDRLPERAGQAFIEGGAEAVGPTKLVKVAKNLAGVADVIEIGQRLNEPVSRQRQITFEQLANKTLDSLRDEYLNRQREIVLLQGELDKPSTDQRTADAIRSRIWALHDEQRQIRSTQVDFVRALPAATTQDWRHLVMDVTPSMR